MNPERGLIVQTPIERPYKEVAKELGQEPWRLFQAATGSLTGELRVRVGGFDVGRPLRVELGSLEADEAACHLPVHWTAEAHGFLFPTMHGELSAEPVIGGITRLSLSGRYRPPLGLPGRLLNHLAGHRLARVAVGRLLRDLAVQLERGRDRAR